MTMGKVDLKTRCIFFFIIISVQRGFSEEFVAHQGAKDILLQVRMIVYSYGTGLILEMIVYFYGTELILEIILYFYGTGLILEMILYFYEAGLILETLEKQATQSRQPQKSCCFSSSFIHGQLFPTYTMLHSFLH